MDAGAWWPTVHRVTKSRSRLSNFTHFTLIAQLVKNLPAMWENLSLIPGLRRSPGEGHGNSLQYSGLENSMDREAWWARVHGVTKSQTQWATRHSTAYHEQGWKGRLKGANIQNNNTMLSGKSIWQQSLCPCLTEVPRLLCDSELALLCFECCSFLSDTKVSY